MKNIVYYFLAIIAFINYETLSEQTITPDNSTMKYFGRVSSDYEFDWPGIYLKVNFTGTSIKAVFSGNGQYNVFIDGNEYDKIWSAGTHTIATNLKDTVHSLLITKVNETNWKTSTFEGLIIDDNATLLEPIIKEHRIEYIGDSFMVGYASESGSNSSDHPNPTKAVSDSTNTYKAFPAVSARTVGVEYQVNAYSGLGVLNDGKGDTAETLPTYYDYTIHSDKSVLWDFSKWIPDIVVIGLEINDFVGGAEQLPYENALNSFIEKIRSNYNNHPYFILTSTSVYQSPEALIAVENVVNSQSDEGHKVFLFNYEYFNLGFSAWNGVHWHPNVEEHAAIGASLADKIDSIVNEYGWPEISTATHNIITKEKRVIVNKTSTGIIGFTNLAPGNYSLKIFNTAGRLIKIHNFKNPTKHYTANLTIKPGVYYMRLSDKNGLILSNKTAIR